jgi:hypothetical protein
MLVTSLAIALVSSLVRDRPVHELLTLTVIIYGSLNVLKSYAPKVYECVLQGIGNGFGVSMSGAVLPAGTPPLAPVGVLENVHDR